MSPKQRKLAKQWVENWRELGPMLEKLRIEEHRASDLGEVLLSLSDVNDASLRAHPPKPTSGVIEMQYFFKKLSR